MNLKYMNFSDFLGKKKFTPELELVVGDFVAVFPEVMKLLRKGGDGYTGSVNATGDKQIGADIESNKLFVEALQKNKSVALIGSEELEEPVVVAVEGESYSVFFDPLDGSSLADVNLSVGTIVGIYKGSEVLARSGRDLVCSIVAIYGPALTFMIAFAEGNLGESGGGGGVYEFVYDFVKGEFVLSGEKLKLEAEGRIFSPGNLNVAMEVKWYHEMLHYWLEEGYKLRYSGGMAPDVNQILKKGGGVYAYPASSLHPHGKLRLLYECAPVALLVEQAGGRAVSFMDKKVVETLDIPITEYHQIAPFICGSSGEVEKIISKNK